MTGPRPISTLAPVVVGSLALFGCSLNDTADGTFAPSTSVNTHSLVPSHSEGSDASVSAPSDSNQTGADSDPGASVGSAPSAVVSIAATSELDGSVIVGGYVQGVVEDGGECRFVILDSDGSEVWATSMTAVANVDTTSCGSPSLERGVIPAGDFSVVLEYQGGAVVARSLPVTLEVRE